LTAALCVVTVLAVACSDNTKVGSGLQAGQGSTTTGCRLGECTTTTASTTSTTAARVSTTTRPRAASVAPSPSTTAAARQAVLVITIHPDSAGHQFQPRVANVRRGTLIRWTNGDSVSRSVEADNGEFASPPLAPGASFEFTAQAAGSFNYHDGTRPYAVGTLEVSP
jgi:plastocyanin